MSVHSTSICSSLLASVLPSSILVCAAACVDDGADGAAFHVSGKLAYERVPFDPEGGRLDYDASQQRPIRGASVRLIDADTDEELASTWSDEDGKYAFEYGGAARVKLWVFAETSRPAIRIEDNTAGDAIYVMESATVDSAADATLDVLAATGWTGSGYGDPRNAAPFAILDTVYTATGRFLAETAPPPEFVPLVINWSVENRPEFGDYASGQIGTTQWYLQEVYILGKEDINTDEFDTHIIVHEWCHSFLSTLMRSDSIGGMHVAGQILDPRVAWDEGACNAMSAIILDPDFVYFDTGGVRQGESFTLDLEYNPDGPEYSPGWFSEFTVGAILLDLYDATDEPFDRLSIGLQGIYDGLVAQKGLPARTTLFSFIAPVKDARPQDAAAIDALVVHHTADDAFGVGVVEDQWGTGETHVGGDASNLPLYTVAVPGEMYTRDLLGGEPFNNLGQSRYFRITGDGLPIWVDSTCAFELDLAVFHLGEAVGEAVTMGGNEELMFDTVDGETYVLVVQGFNDVPGPYPATISISH